MHQAFMWISLSKAKVHTCGPQPCAARKRWGKKHKHVVGIHDQASKSTLKEEVYGNDDTQLFISLHIPSNNNSPISNIKSNQTYLTPNAFSSEVCLFWFISEPI